MKIIGNFDNKKVTFHNYPAGACVQWICLLLANEIANFAFTLKLPIMNIFLFFLNFTITTDYLLLE